MSASESNVFLTGFPAFTAKRMCRKLMAMGHRVLLLAQSKFVDDARQFIDLCGGNGEILEGDVIDLDLGLSGREISRLTSSVTQIHHMASIYHLGVDKHTIHLVNVEGTRSMLRLALEMPDLTRFNFYSTAYVAGDRAGVVLEEELDCGQGFRNVYEESKFAAEKLVRRAMKDLPITVFRPSIIVGDSQSGEIDRFAGPYYLMSVIVNLPLDIHLPLPGKGEFPLNLVPVDFLIDAAAALAHRDDTVGMTFHLTDCNPLPARRVYELVADHAHRKSPKGQFSGSLTKLFLRIPGLEKVSRRPRQFLDQFNHLTIFNNTNTLRRLEGSGICCPPFGDYVGNLVDYMKSQQT